MYLQRPIKEGLRQVGVLDELPRAVAKECYEVGDGSLMSRMSTSGGQPSEDLVQRSMWRSLA